MAVLQPSIQSLVLVILIASVFTQLVQAGRESSLTKFQCPGACKARCADTSHKKPCKKYCNYCCFRCLCVPSGTSGNKTECPCYNNMKTKEGKPKCP